MARAYVLMKVEGGMADKIVKEVRKIEKVSFADAVTGPYDAIVGVEIENIKELGEVIVSKLHSIEGVKETITCLAVGF